MPKRKPAGEGRRGEHNMAFNTKSHPQILERLDLAREKLEKRLGIPLTTSQVVDLMLQDFLREE